MSSTSSASSSWDWASIPASGSPGYRHTLNPNAAAWDPMTNADPWSGQSLPAEPTYDEYWEQYQMNDAGWSDYRAQSGDWGDNENYQNYKSVHFKKTGLPLTDLQGIPEHRALGDDRPHSHDIGGLRPAGGVDQRMDAQVTRAKEYQMDFPDKPKVSSPAADSSRASWTSSDQSSGLEIDTATTPVKEKKGSFSDVMNTSFLSMSFLENDADTDENVSLSYHVVRGERRLGLVIDPGASKGLAGTETLREICAKLVWPKGLRLENKPSTAKLSGIDGIANA